MERATKETQNNNSGCTCNLNEDKNEINASKILSKFGKFQVVFLALFCLVSTWLGMVLFSFVFSNIEPEIVCQIKLENNVSKLTIINSIFLTINPILHWLFLHIILHGSRGEGGLLSKLCNFLSKACIYQ